jgi:hypothetical protein
MQLKRESDLNAEVAEVAEKHGGQAVEAHEKVRVD